MKARVALIDLADTALPLFGDPQREYAYLAAVRKCDAIDGGLEAEVEALGVVAPK